MQCWQVTVTICQHIIITLPYHPCFGTQFCHGTIFRPRRQYSRAVAMSSRTKRKRSSCLFVPRRAVKRKKGNCFDIDKDWADNPGEGGGGYLTKFNTGRLHPEVQPLTLSYTILAEKLPLLYNFYWKKVPLSHTYFRRSCSHFHVVLNKSTDTELTPFTELNSFKKCNANCKKRCK